MELLTQNAKMKKSSQNGITVVNWTIPAFQSKTGLKTCPNAGLCAIGCYARSGTYRFSKSIEAHEAKLALTQTDAFIPEMIKEIDRWLSKKSTKRLMVRIHDAGDFYNVDYLNKWLTIIQVYSTNPRVGFYAYTKQVEMFKFNTKSLFNNFTLIYSFGGRQDSLIDTERDRHAKVFESIQDLKAAGYADGTLDDMVAAIGESKKIGLVYHGVKNFSNTAWSKVS